MLYDVVNFNADASCLSSDAWLNALHGDTGSQLCRWLNLYVELEKPLSIGFTGATLADIAEYNPAALAILKENPDIFQILWRPFAHDIALFRTEAGFKCNLDLGKRAAEHLIGRVSDFFLPPEFMQTNRQTALLAEAGASATIILGSRFGDEVASLIPGDPYMIEGIPDGVIGCVPMNGQLFDRYLQAIQLLDAGPWQKIIRGGDAPLKLWRDGESSFLLPDGLEREKFWLSSCEEPRSHLQVNDLPGKGGPRTIYPVHPFSAWLGEMRMMWYLQRIRELELDVFEDAARERVILWLNCINSDILSSVEKLSPVVKLRDTGTGELRDYRIVRHNRGYEGECLLEAAEKQQPVTGELGWQKKAISRERLLLELL